MPKPANDPIASKIAFPAEAVEDDAFADAPVAEPADWSVTYASNNVLDEPEAVSLEGFVGIGVEHLSNADGDFKVDPATGYIVGRA